ncbi:MAG: hypothetical protein ACTSXQ_07075 [Alphaproteobacteria bacterium]
MPFFQRKFFILLLVAFSLALGAPTASFAQSIDDLSIPEGACPSWDGNEWDELGTHLPCRSSEMTDFSTLQTLESNLDSAQKRFVQTTEERVGLTYDYAEKIAYVLAGFGMLGMVLMAATGHWSWKWFFALCGGLFILAGFQAIIYFIS